VFVFTETVKLSTIDKFEKFNLFDEIFMGFVLVIYKFVCICATVTVEIQTAGTQ
jgi:hypothetical protein